VKGAKERERQMGEYERQTAKGAGREIEQRRRNKAGTG